MQIHKLITKNRITQPKNLESVSIDSLEIPLCIVDPVNDQVLANNSSFSELWSDLRPPSKPSVLFANQLGELITFTEAVDEGGAAQTHDLVPTNTATPNSLWIIQGSKITYNENYALLLVVDQAIYRAVFAKIHIVDFHRLCAPEWPLDLHHF